MTYLQLTSSSGLQFDAPVTLGGQYHVQDENGHEEYHERNYVQTYLGINGSKWNDWDCCVPQLNRKRAYFTSIYVNLQN